VAPVDYERRAPYGMPYMTVLPFCDGDVSNLQGARFFERSQYIAPNDPFPRIQVSLLGANHNFFNSVWSADNDDQTVADSACGPNAVQPVHVDPPHRRHDGSRSDVDDERELLDHLQLRQPRVGRSRADGRPGEGRPGDHGLVLPALHRQRDRVQPLHDGRAEHASQPPAAAGLGLPDQPVGHADPV
jgi:hypothetical protein